MMAKGIIGQPFTFTVLFVDAGGDPIVPSAVTIEVFHFDSVGAKQSLVASGTPMSIVGGDVGRYAYTLTIPGTLTPADQIYSVMTGVDPVSGTDIVVEESVDPFNEGSGELEIQDEGVSLGSFSVINFVGDDVEVIDVGGVATVYIPPLPPPPPPTYASHWNTSDGDTGNQSVSDGISRSTTRISTPNGGEGNPFRTGGWAGSNRSTTRAAAALLSTAGDTTGYGGDATATATVYDADGVTVLDTYTTPALVGDATHTSASGFIVFTITNYGVDDPNYPARQKARMSITVFAEDILTGLGLQGGRYHIEASMTPDSVTDGSGPYTYTQSDVFIDTNPTTPSISGTTSLAETVGSVVTRYLSGVHYYDTGSAFTVGVTGIDQLMRNTGRTSNNLTITPNGVGSRLSTLNQCPFGSGSANFAGWSNDNDVNGVSYGKSDWSLTGANYRLTGISMTASASVRDTWANGNTVTSPALNIVVDTYGTSSTNTAEYFNDESRRQDSTYNGGNTAGNWNSTQALVVGEALVCDGKIQVPNQATITDWSVYNPAGGPNYGPLGGTVSYYRTFVDTAGTNRSAMILNFAGNFLGTATTDLAAEDLKVFIRRRASATGGGAGPAANPLRVHGGLYNFATFDDGATVAGSYVREGTSSGNTVNVTFGGFSCEDGIFIEIQIANPAITVDSLVVSFT
jgi:hypothetical protein